MKPFSKMFKLTLFQQAKCTNRVVKLFVHSKKYSNINLKYSKYVCKRITDTYSPQMCRYISMDHLSADNREEIPKDERYIHKTEVERFIIECMMSVGTEEKRARMIALNLSEADYVGHFSHG